MTQGARKQGQEVGRLSTRAFAWVAWSLFALTVLLYALFLALGLSPPASITNTSYFKASDVLVSLAFLVYVLVGALISSRHPRNAIGWLLCAIGLLVVAQFVTGRYAAYALLVHPGYLPGAVVMAWVSAWVWYVPTGLLLFLLLLFPDGHLPSPNWRWMAWVSVVLTAVGALSGSIRPGRIGGLDSIENPLGVESHLPHLGDTIGLVYLLVLVAAAVSLVPRMRRARGEKRQQIKWFAYAASTLAGSGLLGEGLDILPSWVSFPLILLGLVGVPVAVGIAIFKYRLYDIDLIINRTLVYGPLTATLAALYFGGIVVLQRLFVALTGEQSTLAVVASTLLIAALFTPLRRRIQSFIDRRFYRRKYDARKTLEAFSVKLRDETDLEALNDELVRVVRQTVQPVHVSLWLRPTADVAWRRESPG